MITILGHARRLGYVIMGPTEMWLQDDYFTTIWFLTSLLHGSEVYLPEGIGFLNLRLIRYLQTIPMEMIAMLIFTDAHLFIPKTEAKDCAKQYFPIWQLYAKSSPY